VRTYLKSRLPDYMVPSWIEILDSLPLSPNGKVDRSALPVPDWARPDVSGTFVAPRTATEQLLATMWSEVLGFDRIGVYDNFFELGGHSLLATQIVSRVRNAFQMELPLRTLFEDPTVASLAKAVEAAGSAKEGSTPAAVPRISRRSVSIDQQLAELENLQEDQTRRLLDRHEQTN
jgi:acyl carrier protein